MGLIEQGNTINNGGLGTPLRNAGAPIAGANQADSLASDATGGTFAFSVQVGGARYNVGSTLAYNISAAGLQAALQAALGNSGASCSGGTLGTHPIVIAYSGAQANLPVVSTIDNTHLTGGTTNAVVTPATVGTAGTLATIAPASALLNDTTNTVLYQNTGTQALPVWSKVGGES